VTSASPVPDAGLTADSEPASLTTGSEPASPADRPAAGRPDRSGLEVLLGMIVLAATLESVFAVCLGCLLFAQLMRAGVISPAVCRACHDVSLRYSQNG
jgi:hypothetical protein